MSSSLKSPSIDPSLVSPNARLGSATSMAFSPEEIFNAPDNRDRFRAFADAMPHLVWTATENGDREFFNDQWTAYSGVPEAELVGDRWLAIVHPEDRERVRASWIGAIASGGVYETEYRIRRADGVYRWFAGRGTPLKDASGKTIRWIGTTTDINERRELEQERVALLAEKERTELGLRQLVNSIPGAVWEMIAPAAGVEYLSTNLPLSFVSDYVERLAGYSSAELLAAPELWYTMIEPDDRFVVSHAMQSVIRNGEGSVQCRITHKKGHTVWIEQHIALVRDAEGQPLGLRGVALDVTEHRLLQDALEHSERQLRLITDMVPAFITYIDRDLRYQFVNKYEPGWRAGVTADALGKRVEEVLGSEKFQSLYPKLERALSGEEVRHETTIEGVRGGVFHFDATYVPDRAPDGTVRGAIVLVTDITERKNWELALQSSEEQFRAIANNAPALLWLSDAEGYRYFFNRRWTEFTGLSEDEHIGFQWQRSIHPDDAKAHIAKYEQAIASHTEFQNEFRLRSADGSYRWILVRGVPRFTEAGEFLGLVGTGLNIHDQKLAHEELARAKEVADAANRAKDQFLATLSHELRTPLTPVLTTVEMLESEAELPEKLRPHIQMIRRNVELEARLIDDLLDLTRITRGKVHLAKQSIDLHSLVTNVIEMTRTAMIRKRIQVTLTLSARESHVLGDPARLQQVLWNILQNATKFTPEGGTIEVRSHSGAGSVAIEILDSGIGIEAGHLPHIWDPFDQGDPKITQQFGGLGLGLAISKRLVEMHGGTIEASSDGRDKGAAFTIALATIAAEPESPSRPGTSPQERTLPVRKRILLVDDHADTNASLKILLERRGYDVVTADSSERAIAHYRGSAFDLVISDIGLPDGTGWDLIRAMHDVRHVNAIALSGLCTQEDLRKSRESGFDEHLTKPFNFRELESVIQRLVA